MTKEQKQVKRANAKYTRSQVLAVVQAIIIFGALIFGAGFYTGNKVSDNEHKATQNAVQQAVKGAATLKN